MGSKIITIFMIMAMLILSTGMMTTYKYVGAKQNQDMTQMRVEDSVITVDGEVLTDTEIKLTKAELVEAVRYTKTIENQMKRLNIEGDGNSTLRKITYSGVELTVEEAQNMPSGEYTLTYTDTEIQVR